MEQKHKPKEKLLNNKTTMKMLKIHLKLIQTNKTNLVATIMI
jgi:hypothetical protein